MAPNSVVFLGTNKTGMQVYEWLCERDTTRVLALITEAEQLDLIAAHEPKFVVSCGFSHVVPEEYLEVPKRGCINLHPSLLPYNRGTHANVWAIADRTPAGVSIHRMSPTIDEGDIIAQRRVDTDFSDTGKSLDNRLSAAMVELFEEVWPSIEAGEATLTPQDPCDGTCHRSDELAELRCIDPDEELPAGELLDRIRAVSYPPYRGALIEVDGTEYEVTVEITEKES